MRPGREFFSPEMIGGKRAAPPPPLRGRVGERGQLRRLKRQARTPSLRAPKLHFLPRKGGENALPRRRISHVKLLRAERSASELASTATSRITPDTIGCQ